MCSGDIFELRSTIPTNCLNASVQALSGLHFLLNGLLTFGTVYHATLDFSSRTAFKRTIKRVNFSGFLDFT